MIDLLKLGDLLAVQLRVVVMATLLAVGGIVVGEAAPGLADSEQSAHVLFGRACDDGPELAAHLVESGSGRVIPLDGVGAILGGRYSPPAFVAEADNPVLLISTPVAGARVVDLAGAPQSPIDAGPPPLPYGSHANLAWAPDGAAVAFVATESEKAFIWIATFQSGETTPLIEIAEGGFVTGLDWSPDGSAIVWSSAETASSDPMIYSVDTGGGKPTSLGAGESPRWSPDGTKIAFTLKGKLATMDTSGTAVMLFDQEGRTPVWSPDGKRLAFGGNDGGPGFVGLLSISDQSVIRLFEGSVGCDDVVSVWDWTDLTPPAFDDVPFQHLFYTEIEWMARGGITRGCQIAEFCPDGTVTRGQMAAFLVRALGYQEGAGSDRFVDDDGSTFERDIDRLAAAGVTRGCNPPLNDRFCPNDPVTRGEMAALLVRALGLSDDGGGDLFADDDGSIFEAEIDRLATAEVTRGCNPPANDRFCPDDHTTRAQMAAFLFRALGP